MALPTDRPPAEPAGRTPAPRPMDRRVRKVIVPELTGLRFDDACIVLQQAGLPPPLARYVEAYAEEGSVVEQSPIRGQLVDNATVVQLQVAKVSWVRYLPQVFQLSAQNENQLLHEYLWIFQQLHDKVGHVLDRMPWLFRPQETDPAFLPWLAGWIALGLESAWPVEQQRRWLRRAPALYSIRGTRVALEQMIEMYTGLRPVIKENALPFEPFRLGGNCEIGVNTVVLPHVNLAHCFVVELPRPAKAFGNDEILRIHRVIQMEKPAHTLYFLTFAEQAAADDEDYGLVVGESFLASEDDIAWGAAP
jgi:phage tail-like protein